MQQKILFLIISLIAMFLNIAITHAESNSFIDSVGINCDYIIRNQSLSSVPKYDKQLLLTQNLWVPKGSDVQNLAKFQNFGTNAGQQSMPFSHRMETTKPSAAISKWSIGVGYDQSPSFSQLLEKHGLNQESQSGRQLQFGQMPQVVGWPEINYLTNLEVKDPIFDKNLNFDLQKIKEALNVTDAPSFQTKAQVFCNNFPIPRFQRFEGDDKLIFGNPFNPKKGPKIQKIIDRTFIVSFPASETTKYRCDIFSNDHKDECFLPAVGLSNSKTDTITTNCSGTIVSKNKILTAAHCKCNDPQYVILGTASLNLKSKYKAVNDNKSLFKGISSWGGRSSALIKIVDWQEVGDYCEQRLKRKNAKKGEEVIREKDDEDLAILTIDPSYSFKKIFQAVIITPPTESSQINIAGFGPDPKSKTKDKMKRYLSTKLAQNRGTTLVVKSANGDSCSGDSGSGAYMRLDNGQLGVFGTLSTGVENCDVNKEAIYINVTAKKYHSFLMKNGLLHNIKKNWIATKNMDYCIGVLCDVLAFKNIKLKNGSNLFSKASQDLSIFQITQSLIQVMNSQPLIEN